MYGDLTYINERGRAVNCTDHAQVNLSHNYFAFIKIKKFVLLILFIFFLAYRADQQSGNAALYPFYGFNCMVLLLWNPK